MVGEGVIFPGLCVARIALLRADTNILSFSLLLLVLDWVVTKKAGDGRCRIL